MQSLQYATALSLCNRLSAWMHPLKPRICTPSMPPAVPAPPQFHQVADVVQMQRWPARTGRSGLQLEHPGVLEQPVTRRAPAVHDQDVSPAGQPQQRARMAPPAARPRHSLQIHSHHACSTHCAPFYCRAIAALFSYCDNPLAPQH